MGVDDKYIDFRFTREEVEMLGDCMAVFRQVGCSCEDCLFLSIKLQGMFDDVAQTLVKEYGER